MILNFVFVTDSHIGGGANVRTGNVYQDLLTKFTFIKEYCNKNDCQLLIGGDVFDKPTIADVYKTPFLKLFLQFDKTPIVVRGNHCTLFNSRENDYKTTMQLFIEAGAFKELHTIDYGDLVLTSEKPLVVRNKPQIFMYHGFLNQQDGWCQVMYDELITTDEVLCLLGHDHVVYDPVTIGTVKVIRPGSLLRGIRNDESNRIPELVHIRFNSETPQGQRSIKTKLVPITVSRDPSEIFKTKKVTISEAERNISYESIISQIAQCTKSDLTLEQAVSSVATTDVVEYTKELLAEANSIKIK